MFNIYPLHLRFKAHYFISAYEMQQKLICRILNVGKLQILDLQKFNSKMTSLKAGMAL